MTLTAAERDRIVQLRLAGQTVRAVAEETGHSPTTVTKAWRLHMEESATVRRGDLDVQREEIVLRLEQAAWEAREAGNQAREDGDRVGHVRYLREERDALREIARLTGIDRPLPAQADSTPRHSDESPGMRADRERLKERIIARCEESGEPIPDLDDPRVILTAHLNEIIEREKASAAQPQPEWRTRPDDPAA